MGPAAIDPLLLPAAAPLFGFGLVLLTPLRLRKLRWFISLASVGFPLYFAGRLVAVLAGGSFLVGGEDLSYIFLGPLIGQDRIVPLLFADGLNVLFLACATIATFIIFVYFYSLPRSIEDDRLFCAYSLLAASGLNLALMAGNIVFLLLGWHMVGIALILLLRMNPARDTDRPGPALRTLICIGTGDISLLLAACLIMYVRPASPGDLVTVFRQGVFPSLVHHPRLQFLLASALIAAAVSRLAVIPFHSWLPSNARLGPPALLSYVPVSVSALLGTYVLARLVMNLYQTCYLDLLVWDVLFVIGTLSLLTGTVMAAAQNDLRKLAAWLAVAQAGFSIIGIASGTVVGVTAGIFHSISTVFCMSAFFMVAGNIEAATGSSLLGHVLGIGRRMPSTLAAFVIAAATIAGLPPTSGFVSKWMIVQGLLESQRPVILVAVMFAMALGLAALVRVAFAVFIDRPHGDNPGIAEASPTHTAPPLLLGLACILLGIFPGLVTASLGMLPWLSGRAWSSAWAVAAVMVSFAGGLAAFVLPYRKNASAASQWNSPDGLQPVFPAGALAAPAESGTFDIFSIGARLFGRLDALLSSANDGSFPRYTAYAIIGLGLLLGAALACLT
ncbi:MAG: hypothetical protein JW909_03020 [Planctomycetes bacterium]|nr:hypothetical protein [Planctomycetota bacterium]